jgi:hypothetical protein
MFKRVLLGLIVVLATAAGLYQLRIQILTAAFNSVLAKADVRLLQVDGLEMSWNGVDIVRLVLGVGKDNVPQTLSGVHFAYSIVDIQPQSLVVRHAVLTPPGSGEAQASDGPLRLSEILDQIMTGPLQSITVDALEVDGFSSPMLGFPIAVQADWEDGEFVFEAADRTKKLLIVLNQLATKKRTLVLKLAVSGKPAIEIEIILNRQGDRQHIDGAGQLWVEGVTEASGKLQFRLSGQLDDELQRVEQQGWQLQILPQSTLELELADNNAEISLQLKFPQSLTASMQATAAQGFELSLAGEAVAWRLYEHVNKVTAVGQLSGGIKCQYSETAACRALLDIELSAPQITVTGEQPLLVQDLKLQFSAQLELADDHLGATLASGEWLRAETLARGDTFAVAPALVADSAGKLNYQLSTGELRFQLNDLRLMLPQVQLPQVNVATLLNLQDLKLTLGESGQLDARVRLAADAINVQGPDTWLPALAIDSEVIVAGQRVSLQGQVQGGGQKPLFEVSADVQMDTGRGTARVLSDEMIFNADGNRLSQYFGYWPFEWDIFAGKLMLDVGLNWQDGEFETELQAVIKQRAEDIAGVYQDIGFVGLDSNFEASFRSPGQLVTTSAATVSLESLDVGVPIEGIQARFLVDSSQQKLTLETVEAHLFGGRVWIEDAVYLAEKAHNPIFVGVDGLQLEQLLELAGYDAVKGTGTISGLLPLDVNKAGITMSRGMLAAKSPGGVFSYTTDITAGTNPAMVQVIEALRNYQYSIFQVEADYLENGDLVLAIILRGSNPDLQQGRPIHLNLNVTDNIPTLLRSLQAGRKIADSVSKKWAGDVQ